MPTAAYGVKLGVSLTRLRDEVSHREGWHLQFLRCSHASLGRKSEVPVGTKPPRLSETLNPWYIDNSLYSNTVVMLFW